MAGFEAESGPGARGRNRARWRAHLKRWAESGLSGAAYCGRHGLNPKCFYRWRRIFAESGRDGQGAGLSRAGEGLALFAELRLPDGGGSGVEVCVAGGRTIRVAVGFDAPTLCRVVTALEGNGSC